MTGIDKRKTEGWFSRRHKTAEAHNEARAKRDTRVAQWEATMRENEQERAKRSPSQQLALLDKRLGKGRGAKKERARLKLQIEKKGRKKKD